MLQTEASLIDNTRVVIYDHDMFIIQATGQQVLVHTSILLYNINFQHSYWCNVNGMSLIRDHLLEGKAQYS